VRRGPMSELIIEDLQASVAGKPILHGVTLTVRSGEVHAVMGPNGSGKSTLSNVLMGRPGYEVTGGSVRLDGVNLLELTTWERAHAGLFLAQQYPTEVPGVAVRDVLSEALVAVGRGTDELDAAVLDEAGRIGLDASLLERAMNVDLSGGEKKRNETLQLAVLRPRIAVLDEIDSGLDVDALRSVARRIEAATTDGFGGDHSEPLGALVITHYNRLLEELHPDVVHVFAGGRIQRTGGPELATELEESGYAEWAHLTPTETTPERPVVDDPFFAGGTL
ncbi:MAG: Fe-S cluster assembly ATPase SufC, partial [Actinomycetes bacterium]